MRQRRVEPGKAISWLHGAPTAADERLHMVVADPKTSVLAVDVSGQGFVRANAMFGASPVSGVELRFPKVVALRSPTPGVDMERIVGLRAYQEMGEAAVTGPDFPLKPTWRELTAGARPPEPDPEWEEEQGKEWDVVASPNDGRPSGPALPREILIDERVHGSLVQKHEALMGELQPPQPGAGGAETCTRFVVAAGGDN